MKDGENEDVILLLQLPLPLLLMMAIQTRQCRLAALGRHLVSVIIPSRKKYPELAQRLDVEAKDLWCALSSFSICLANGTPKGCSAGSGGTLTVIPAERERIE